jgi:hypothetical protein
MPAINVESLQDTAIQYQKELLWLPLIGLEDSLKYLTLVPNIQNERKITTFERTNGILKPHTGSVNLQEDLGKTVTRTLKVYPGDVVVEDFPENYRTVAYGPDVLLGKNQSKKHPWELVMLRAIMESVSEDLNLSLFCGQRSDEMLDAYHVFDGFDTIINNELDDLMISPALGNMYDDSWNGSESLVQYLNQMWRAAPLELKRRKTIMYVSQGLFEQYNLELGSEMGMFIYGLNGFGIDRPAETKLWGSEGRCTLAPMIGKQESTRVLMTDPGNLEVGVDQTSDQEFIEVRRVDNPFVVQFVVKLVFGVQVQSLNKKRFFVDGGSDSEIPVSGSGSGSI